MKVRRALYALALPVAFACGGAAPGPAAPPPAGSAAPSASASAEPPSVSVVRFDDLGVSLAVPSGYHVVGDDDLAARVRASANPRLTAALESRAPQKKGLPLLTLSNEPAPGDSLTLTLTAMVVPADADVAEMLEQQQTVMKENLEGFAAVGPSRSLTVDGVAGREVSDRYALPAGGGVRKVASTLRLFVRKGLAFVIVAVWSDGAPHEAEALGLLDGLHFYDAQP